MGYVLNLTNFLTALLSSEPGRFVYNYADKPDLSMNELIEVFHHTMGKNHQKNFNIPYAVGLMGGYCYDILAKITGKTYPVSSIRIKKFCSDTVINTDKLQQTGFVPTYTLAEGLKRMIKIEFVTAGVQSSKVHGSRLKRDKD